MNYLTDVKAERFLCTQCREYAKIVFLEGMELAWCDSFECTNTASMIKINGRWEEHAHEDVFDLDIIQGLMLKSFMAQAQQGQDDNTKISPLDHRNSFQH